MYMLQRGERQENFDLRGGSLPYKTYDTGSLIERWCPETHTSTEMTIRLQDVAIILGLRIHRSTIIGTNDID